MPETALLSTPRATAVDRGVGAAVDWLLARQSPAGWWTAELETNATMTAEHVLLLRFLGIDDAPIRAGAIRHLLGCQREDGSWAKYADGPADLSTTAEAYAALKLLGVDPASAPMRRALRVVHEQGGLACVRVFTKIWFALFGEHPWEGVPSMPPELVWLPPRVPLNLYDFAAWARGTIAPLLVVLARKPVRPLGVSLAELVVPGTEAALRRVPGSGVFWWLDGVQKLYERLPAQPLRGRAIGRVLDWVVERQEADGSWGGIQPPWVYSLIALHVEGMPLDHPVMARGLRGLDGFALEDQRGWRLQACASPVWDTALAVLALRDALVPATHDAIVRAVNWLLEQQVDALGDWAVRVPGARDCGGWPFEFANQTYPDVDDTTVVALALLRCGSTPALEASVRHGAEWVLAMRSRGGAWAAFDRDNTRQLVYRLPFADFGALLDPPTEDVTAHAVEMLAALGFSADSAAMAPAIAYLVRNQTPEGSWFGRWGVNHLYGTWSAIAALRSAGAAEPAVRRGADWLERVQRRDGAWGETCMSYNDASFAGVGLATASQTAWALLGLQRAGRGGAAAAAAGTSWLLDRQDAGTWDEPLYTGTGFPRDFYINYHLYRHLFPLMALAGASNGGAH